jgi:hypothetical protein
VFVDLLAEIVVISLSMSVVFLRSEIMRRLERCRKNKRVAIKSAPYLRFILFYITCH